MLYIDPGTCVTDGVPTDPAPACVPTGACTQAGGSFRSFGRRSAADS